MPLANFVDRVCRRSLLHASVCWNELRHQIHWAPNSCRTGRGPGPLQHDHTNTMKETGLTPLDTAGQEEPRAIGPPKVPNRRAAGCQPSEVTILQGRSCLPCNLLPATRRAKKPGASATITNPSRSKDKLPQPAAPNGCRATGATPR